MIMRDIKPITIVPITITLTSLITLLLVLVISYYYIILRPALLRSQQLHYKRFTITTTTRLLLRCSGHSRNYKKMGTEFFKNTIT